MMVNECVCVDWYRFKGKCAIKTCKFNTDVLASGCIAIERKDTHSKKLLTDRELSYYKFNNSISVNDVTQHRKKAMVKAKKLIALYYYTQFLLNTCKIKQTVVPESCLELLTKFPFKLSKLNITSTILGNMFIIENFESYKIKVKLDQEYRIWDMFLMTQKKWEVLYSDFLNANKG